jgi:hypothetical protein
MAAAFISAMNDHTALLVFIIVLVAAAALASTAGRARR